MNEILHANIFFFIASIATVIFCILICIIMYQVFKILRSLRSIMERIEAGSEMIAEDMAHVRTLVAGGGVFSRVISFVLGSTLGKSRSRKRRSADD